MDLDIIIDIMITCIIMHNMIIEDEQDLGLEQLFGQPVAAGEMHSDFIYHDLKVGTRQIENMHIHFALQNDINNHLWVLRGQNRY
jgi:hypothetical protein